MSETTPLLSVRDLSVAFTQNGAMTTAVDRISFDIAPGETVAIVGESGSGKSVSALSAVRLLPYPAASHPSGEILFKGVDVMRMDDAALRKIRGNEISMIFQEPMTSLNPLHTVEKQIAEDPEDPPGHGRTGSARPGARPARQGRHPRSRDPAAELPAPAFRRAAPARDDRHGAGQRAGPADCRRAHHRAGRDRTGADPPTLEGSQRDTGMAMLFITHDLGIVRKIADRVCVMTRGQVVEEGPVERIFTRPGAPLHAAPASPLSQRGVRRSPTRRGRSSSRRRT